MITKLSTIGKWIGAAVAGRCVIPGLTRIQRSSPRER